MNSSPKIIHPDADSNLVSWAFTDFYAGKALDNEAQKERINAIFKPELKDRPAQAAPVSSKSFHPANSGELFNSWQLVDLSQRTVKEQPRSWEFSEVQDTAWAGVPIVENVGIDLDDEVGKVLSQARLQAEEIILQAQKSADEAISQAQAEVDQAVSEGYQQGWSSARAEAESVLKAAQAMIEEVGKWRDDMLAHSEMDVIDMVQEIARVMFGDGVALDNSALQVNFNRVLENATSLGDLKIFINPADSSVLDPSWKEMQAMITGNKVQLIPTDDIKRGGCYVQGKLGTVDARIDTELHAVIETLNDVETSTEKNE
ncbi:MAG: FliH/SctL family protein [Anaerolineaceae bacterium]|nr:FliH/SctL family protein [Anaerolineaceae bacterium]